MTKAQVASADEELDEAADACMAHDADLGARQQAHLHEASTESALSADFDDASAGTDGKFSQAGHSGGSPARDGVRSLENHFQF